VGGGVKRLFLTGTEQPMTDHLITRRALIALPVLTFAAPVLARGRGGGRSGGRSFGGRGGRGGFGSIVAWLVLGIPIAIFVIYLLRTEKPAPKPVTPPKEAWDAAGLCLLCGSRMIRRVASRGKHKGNPFYGCANYPRCKGIRLNLPANDQSVTDQ
jgi:hypothetical protein